MRHYRLLFILTLALCCTLNIYAQTRLYIDNFKICSGETKRLEIKMQNDLPIRALQARLVLPEELELASRPTLNADRIGNYTDVFGNIVNSQKNVSYNKWDDRSYMIVINSDDAIAFSGNDGAILSMDIKSKENTQAMDVIISLCDIELVHENGVDFIKQDTQDCNVAIFNIHQINATTDGNGNVSGGGNYETGSEVSLTAIPHEGYKFYQWSNGSTENPYIFIAKENINLSAIFTKQTFQLTYKVDGADYKEYTIEYAAAITPEEHPQKEGHTFSGWQNLPKTMPAKDVIVNGTFMVNSYKAVFKIGEEIIKTINVEYGQPIVAPEAPLKEGHTFTGWNNIPEKMPAKDIEIIGNYNINSYKLTYKVDGADYKEYTIDYATTITPEEHPQKEGHTFSGWQNLPKTMPAKDVIVNGTFMVNSYTLRIYLNQELYRSELLEYGMPIIIEDPIVPNNMKFDGWESDIPEIMPAHDVNIYGTYSTISSISSIELNSSTNVTIYSLHGNILYKNELWSEIKEHLKNGVYIINGVKVYIKR